MNLIEAGIPLLDSIYLVQDYIDDLDWFVPELLNKLKKVNIMNELNQSVLLGMIQGLQSKKGIMNFRKWRTEKMKELEELEIENMSIFERLRKSKSMGTNTLFDKLKFIKENR